MGGETSASASLTAEAVYPAFSLCINLSSPVTLLIGPPGGYWLGLSISHPGMVYHPCLSNDPGLPLGLVGSGRLVD